MPRHRPGPCRACARRFLRALGFRRPHLDRLCRQAEAYDLDPLAYARLLVADGLAEREEEIRLLREHAARLSERLRHLRDS
jgi:hypothetical protein